MSFVLTHIRFFATASTTLPSRKQPEAQDICVCAGLTGVGGRESGVGEMIARLRASLLRPPTPDSRPSIPFSLTQPEA